MKNKIAIMILVPLFTIACGGGSSSSSTTGVGAASTMTFPAASAIANISANGLSSYYTMTGSLDGVPETGSGTFTVSPAVSANFEGQLVLEQTETLSGIISGNASTLNYDKSRKIYSTTNYNPLGEETDSEYWVIQAHPSLPSLVKVGDTAVIGTYTRYTDSTKTNQLGSAKFSYAVERDTSSTAILNFITNTYSTSGLLQTSTQLRYRIDSNANVSWVSETDTSYGASVGTLTFTGHM